MATLRAIFLLFFLFICNAAFARVASHNEDAVVNFAPKSPPADPLLLLRLWTDSSFLTNSTRVVPKVGLAALAAGAIYFTTLDPDKRRKHQKRQQDNHHIPFPIKHAVSYLSQIINQSHKRQLLAKVKDTYAGLVTVEANCLEVDNRQAALAAPGAQPRLSNEEWQCLVALHHSLLNEHYDFLATQHPSASHAVRSLASKYAMPARMWRHGIYSFLELMRYRFPEFLEYVKDFIYYSYSMMALLYETVPAFEDSWIECLGNTARYRMAIEADDIKERDIFAGLAKH